MNRLFHSTWGTDGSVINVGGGSWLVSTTCKRCTSAANCRETASAYGIALREGREKSIGTRIRLNRSGRDVLMYRRGLRLTCAGIRRSTKLFTPSHCVGSIAVLRANC